jgi:hypothetical protein
VPTDLMLDRHPTYGLEHADLHGHKMEVIDPSRMRNSRKLARREPPAAFVGTEVLEDLNDDN